MTTSFALLGSTTLGSTNATITVTFTAKKYLIVELYATGSSGSKNALIFFNNDSGNNYSYRESKDGAADATSTTQNVIAGSDFASTVGQYSRFFIINIASQEKLVSGHTIIQNTAGAGNVPDRQEFVGKWTNTSNQITEIDIGIAGQTWNTGTTLTVYGSD
jgi:hypothetical protein